MRVATLDERREFYESEFDLKSVSNWIAGRARHMKFAMILGRHTGVVSPEHAKAKNDVVIIDDWDNAGTLKDYAIDYLPESMYYDRNRYVDVRDCARCEKDRTLCRDCYNVSGQQLAFDLDPENVDCPYHGHIGNKIQNGRALSFCMFEFKAVRRQAATLRESLRLDYERVEIVYSGRGFHVVVDDEEAYKMSMAERSSLARKTARRYAIDEWVTKGESRLMRLPYSLSSLVSRKCMIIRDERDLSGFDPRVSISVIPRFLRSA